MGNSQPKTKATATPAKAPRAGRKNDEKKQEKETQQGVGGDGK